MSIEEVKNEQLGEVWCPFQCGSVAYVFKNKRKSLYAQCPVCKCIQPTGAPAQAYFSQYQPIGTLRGKPAPETPTKQPQEPQQPIEDMGEAELTQVSDEPRPKNGGIVVLLGLIAATAAAVGINR